MKLKFNQKGLGHLLLIYMLILLMIHLLILFGKLPPEIIWDTTITDAASIAISESIALFFIIFFIFGVLLKLGYIKLRYLQKNADAFLWLMIVYFSLNVVGNFMSDDGFKKLFYAPITIVGILLTLRLIFSAPPKKNRSSRPNTHAGTQPKKRRIQP